MVHESKVLPARGADGYPLSPLQQGMLYHKLEGSSVGVDLEQVICELREPVDPGKFRQAWEQVAARHEILRTGFHLDHGGEPRQVVLPAPDASLEFHYEEFPDEAETRRALQAYLVTDRRRSFPRLDRPLFRVALLRGGPEYFWFVTTFDHLLLDGRALVVMFKEALDRHDALVAGRAIDLPAPTPYRQYIEWLQSLDGSASAQFWREHLKGLGGPTVLPVPRPAAAGRDDVDARGELACRLSSRATAMLRATAAWHNVTLNTMMQAAWAIVLGRYTGETDVVFGAVRACRRVPVPDAGSIVGLFINTVPVRGRVPPETPVGDWLRELRQQWVALREHEHTPLMKVQQWSGLAPGRALFETLFNYQEPSWDAALRELGGRWRHRNFDIVSQPNYPLAVDAYGGAVITIKMLYDRRRFTDETVGRLLGHYRVVVEALAAGRPATVGEVPLLPTSELRQLLTGWNRTAREYPSHECVHARVAAQAAATPGRLAVADATKALTYAELDGQAGRLARRLQAHGVGPETIVAVCLERSADLLVAWLAVLKAGGAFCPLDPDYPADRLGFMLEDSRTPVVVTRRALAARLPRHRGVVIEVDEYPANEDTLAGAFGRGRPETGAARPDNLAYVIYTSGSTGQPKGVMIEHRSLMNLVTWHQRAFGLTAADRATQLASPAFDASVWEVWPYLAAGASVHIPPEEARVSPALLWRWLAEHRITLSFLPTPLLEAAMSEPWPAGLALRLVLTGGDRLRRPPPADFPCVVVNNYGPTENTVVATSGPVGRRADPGALPTIGRPIANTRACVLDSQMRPVPPGVPGELYLGGDSLARGYLRRPELTAEKFVPDPFAEDAGLQAEGEAQTAAVEDPESKVAAKSHEPPTAAPATGNSERRTRNRASRLYRTGDRVRWTEEGELEFLGRLDGQVKIRGCRLELGEIEAVLQRHPAVRECLAVIRPDERAEPQIVAYVLPSRADGADRPSGDDRRIQGVELTAFLREKLPAYMMPSAIVTVDRWPLTPNGKIDREALPAPGPRAEAEAGAPPAGETERTVARVWSELLGRGPIGRHDNFFELGGHSLLAAQVVSRLNHALKTTLSVRAVFDQPTVAALARELENRRKTGAGMRSGVDRPRRRRAAELLQPN